MASKADIIHKTQLIFNTLKEHVNTNFQQEIDAGRIRDCPILSLDNPTTTKLVCTLTDPTLRAQRVVSFTVLLTHAPKAKGFSNGDMVMGEFSTSTHTVNDVFCNMVREDVHQLKHYVKFMFRGDGTLIRKSPHLAEYNSEALRTTEPIRTAEVREGHETDDETDEENKKLVEENKKLVEENKRLKDVIQKMRDLMTDI